MMKPPVIQISDLNFHYGKVPVLQDFNWEILKGENWMIGGLSGTGKTTLGKIIAGEIKNYEGKVEISFDENIDLPAKVLYIPNWFQFRNLEGGRNFYYQQRYNKFSKNDTLTVFAELQHFAKHENLSMKEAEYYLEIFGFNQCKEQQLIELSSGEHKKLQLIKAFWLQPQILIIDQPYTGLDFDSRRSLNLIFQKLSSKGISFLLINNEEEFPDCVTHFAEIKKGKLAEVNSPEEFLKDDERKNKPIPYFLVNQSENIPESIVKMEKIHISYGEKKVLNNISWEVQKGEKWLLQGHNGSGKSTLLSLINGDHPQAYANNIHLFGNKRGSGESIWEIKERIGIISPELHWYFDMNANVGQTIASGFFESMSLYQKLGYEQHQQLEQILNFFDLKEEKNKKMAELSLGKQRLVLLARTIVKKPELLILDEPCQGMDVAQTNYFNRIIDDLCEKGQTLIYVGHFESRIPDCIDHKLVLEKGEIKSVEKTNHFKTNQV